MAIVLTITAHNLILEVNSYICDMINYQGPTTQPKYFNTNKTSKVIGQASQQQNQKVSDYKQMRQAKRLFSKSHKQIEESPSSVFRSKINRDLPDQSKRSSIGPGQYNVALPIVKPKFQAIRKNNNTLIIKVNQKLSPVFQSLEPRFKESRREIQEENEPSNEMYALVSKNKEPSSLEKQNKISLGMKNRLKKLAEIINFDEIKQKQKLNLSYNSQNSNQLQTIDGNREILNSLKLYKKERERLHFLLKNIKNKNNSKGFEWSKYRETKGNLYSISNVPGPGSYQRYERFNSTNRYIDATIDKSWQFKSLTKRNSFGKIGQEKQYQVSLSRNRFVSDIDGRFYKVDSIPLIQDQIITDDIEIV